MNFFATIWAVCTSFAAYRAVRDVPFVDALLYLVRLVALLVVVMLIGLIPPALRLADRLAAWADVHLPQFALQSGRVVTALPQPYYGGTAEWRIILDTTGQVTEPDPQHPRGALIGADSVLIWLTLTNRQPPIVQSQRHSLRGFPDGTVNADYVRRLLRSAIWAGLPFIYALLVVGGVILVLAQAHFFGLLGAVLERRHPNRLGFCALRNIALYATTPAGIIVAVYTAARVPGIDLWLVYLIAFSVFLIGGTNASRTEPPTSSLADDEST